jgi:hypothetical protein
MASINASTSGAGGVITTADATGILNIQTAGTTAITVDASQNVAFAKGFTVGATAAPAFSATKSASQTVTSGVFTTVTFDIEQFDTNNNFASNTFTPTVAGYYQINGNVYASATTITRLLAQILKNGGSYRFGVDVPLSVGAGEYRSTVSAIVYMNGTTDYLNLAALVIGTGTIVFGSGIDNCALNGVLVRTA